MEVKLDLKLITSEMDELKKQKAALDFDLKNVKTEIEKRELQLIALLNQMEVKEMQYGVYSFGLKLKKRTALDQKYLKEHYADIVEKCTFTKENESFEFKINK